MYLKLEFCVVCREFLAFKFTFIIFDTNQMIIYICSLKILKTYIKTRFFYRQYPIVFELSGKEY